MARRATADLLDRVDAALDAHAIPRSREVEAFEEWIDSFDNEVDMNETEETVR